MSGCVSNDSSHALKVTFLARNPAGETFLDGTVSPRTFAASKKYGMIFGFPFTMIYRWLWRSPCVLSLIPAATLIVVPFCRAAVRWVGVDRRRLLRRGKGKHIDVLHLVDRAFVEVLGISRDGSKPPVVA